MAAGTCRNSGDFLYQTNACTEYLIQRHNWCTFFMLFSRLIFTENARINPKVFAIFSTFKIERAYFAKVSSCLCEKLSTALSNFIKRFKAAAFLDFVLDMP